MSANINESVVTVVNFCLPSCKINPSSQVIFIKTCSLLWKDTKFLVFQETYNGIASVKFQMDIREWIYLMKRIMEEIFPTAKSTCLWMSHDCGPHYTLDSSWKRKDCGKCLVNSVRLMSRVESPFYVPWFKVFCQIEFHFYVLSPMINFLCYSFSSIQCPFVLFPGEEWNGDLTALMISEEFDSSHCEWIICYSHL